MLLVIHYSFGYIHKAWFNHLTQVCVLSLNTDVKIVTLHKTFIFQANYAEIIAAQK